MRGDDEALAIDPSEDSSGTLAFRTLTAVCRHIPGFAIADRVIVANFSYAKLPMVRDLEHAQAEIEGHALLSAIAGDTDARAELRERHRALDIEHLPVVPFPPDEFLVLDADSTQSMVIAAAVAGADLVVVGPPGTGKSQTISNLIATLSARGKAVLFVAEKRAAIDAVLGRLRNVGLDDLVFDLHDGPGNRRRNAQILAGAIAAAGATPAPDVQALHTSLQRHRTELEQYAHDLHERTEPWHVSAFEAQMRILRIPESARSDVRFRGDVLAALDAPTINAAIEDLRSFCRLGGTRLLAPTETAALPARPWATAYTARMVTSESDVLRAIDELTLVARAVLPGLADAIARVCTETHLPAAHSLAEVRRTIELVRQAITVDARFTPDAYALDLPALATAMRAAAGWQLGRLFASWFDGDYRRARAALRAVDRSGIMHDQALLAAVQEAQSTAERWRATGIATPVPSVHLAALEAAAKTAADAFGELVEHLALMAPDEASIEAVAIEMQRLLDDRETLMRLPDIRALEDRLRALELTPIIDLVLERDITPDEAAEALEYAWTVSVLDAITLALPALRRFDATSQHAEVVSFRRDDVEHIATSASRVRRAWALGAVRARDTYPSEAALVSAEAGKKQRHRPLREFYEGAEHVLAAVKPCWVMSPLVVSQVLPRRACFDVVIFDEASQIPPADAICALLRGRQAIVAGDPKQLPPTAFFTSAAVLDDPDDDEEIDDVDDDLEPLAVSTPQLRSTSRVPAPNLALTRDVESLLDVMSALLPPPYGTRTLGWHYRSQDERLIAFSNAQDSLYDWALQTFPGALGDDCLRFEHIPFRPNIASPTSSNTDEVERVVDLILEHAASHDESLGVIALGIKHAQRIEEALRLRRQEHPELDPFFDDGRVEPFFVKNLERVQGDERDAIILSVGYAKTADGRMQYRFGPLNLVGGERRLNVAITRARRRMTVTTSFAGSEMDPERLHAIGAKMLRDYLLYVESGGTNLGVRTKLKPDLNPFERDVLAHLERSGLRVVPQYGASGYWIDFALMHPERPGEPVLAVESDGVTYHSSQTARDRDRLRQQHLERLGWRFCRIWSTEWFRHRESELTRVLGAFKQALADRDMDKPPSTKPALMAAPRVAAPATRSPRPPVRRGHPIGNYSQAELRNIVRWVNSDSLLRTTDEVLAEVMNTLGFDRRGSKIVETIKRAIQQEMAHYDNQRG